MKRPDKYGEGPITAEELSDVFGYVMLNTDGVLIDRMAPKSRIGEGRIIVPTAVKADRQTGATSGFILQLGETAEEEMNKLLKRSNLHVEIGGLVGFSYAAPIDPGLMDENGLPIQSGFTDSPYAGLGVLNYRDVIGYIPKERAAKFSSK